MTEHGDAPKLNAAVTAMRWVFGTALPCLVHYTGLAWLTPFVGVVDKSDLEYLLAAVGRDLAWLDVILKDPEPPPDQDDPPKVREKLAQVRAALEDLVGRAHTNPTSSPVLAVARVRFPWDVPRGWTDYGAIRVALLASLPHRAQLSALQELRNMDKVVLKENREEWGERAKALKDVILASTTTPEQRVSIPHELQALWREIDFGRNSLRARVAKQTTITQIIWAVVLPTTLAVTFFLSKWKHTDGFAPVVPWLVTLLGAMGGGASALQGLSITTLPDWSSLEVESVRLRLRPVVGALAAIVVYVVARSGLIFDISEHGGDPASGAAHIQVVVQAAQIPWVYYALAFAAGLSERLFLSLVSGVGDRFGGGTGSAKGS